MEHLDPTWFNIAIAFITLIVVLVSMLIGTFFKMSKDVSILKTHLAEHYVSKEEFRSHTDRLERQMETGFNRLYSRLSTSSD